MAFCPKCKGQMGPTELVCPNCGYDFPNVEGASQQQGFAYSPMADAALVVSMIAAGLGSLVAVAAAVMALLSGQLLTAVVGVIAIFLQFGMLVVFIRVSDLKK